MDCLRFADGHGIDSGSPQAAFSTNGGGSGLHGLSNAGEPAAVAENEDIRAREGREKPPRVSQADNLATLLPIDDLSLEIGFQLIPLVDEKQGGQMLARVRALRKHLAKELGFIIPPVHITDNLRLKPREYTISLRNAEIARWQTEGNQLLAVNADPKARALPESGNA